MKSVVAGMRASARGGSAAGPIVVGLAVQAATTYLTLILAGRILGAASFAGVAALYAVLTAVATGLFQPLEQEISRRRGTEWETRQVEAALLRRSVLVGLGLSAAAVLVALLLYGPTVRLLGGEPQLLIAFCVGLPGYALCFVVRGMLSGSRRLGRYGLQLSVEGSVRLVGLGLLAAVGVSSAAAYGWLFAVAPWVAVGACLLGLPRAAEAPSATGRAATPLVAPIGLLLVSSLAAQLLIGAGPVTAQLFADPADQAMAGAFLAALVVVRVPVLLFTAVQPSMLPALAAHVAADRRAGFVSLLGKVFAAMAALALGTILVTATLGPWALRLLFGPDFVLSAGIFLLMGVSVGLFLTAVVFGQGILALGQHKLVSAGWLVGLVGLAAGTALASDPILRATLGLLVGAAAVTATFGFLLWRSLRRWSRAPSMG